MYAGSVRNSKILVHICQLYLYLQNITVWGNGIPNVSGYINDPNESSRVIIVNIKMGHKDYSVIGQVVGATAK